MSNQPRLRGWRRLEELLESQEFLADIEAVRSHNEFQRVVDAPYIAQKYNLPTTLTRVIANYIETGNLDELLVDDYVRVDSSGAGVSLKLSFDINQEQLLQFVKTKWSSAIEPQLNKKFGPREKVYAAYYPKRNEEIYRDYLELEQRNRTFAYLMTKYDLSKAQIYKIIRRQKSLSK